MASSAPFIAVMDADLQHDEAILPLMLDAARSSAETDLVVASRYADGGSLGALAPRRRRISALATRLSRMILKSVPSDPMSGFFLIRREAFDRCVRRLSGIGFKILLDVLASSPRPLRLQEVAYTFRDRASGESKLDTRVAWDFVMLLLHKRTGTLVPVRFLTFSLVGGFGIVVHFAMLYALFGIAHIAFDTAQAGATLVAMTSNYALNNALTYRDMRLTGWSWLRGWVTFCLGCSLGALANVGIASYLFQKSTPWGLSALVGVLVGAVWNYAVTSVYTWKRAKA
jgi:dolichol-phosphate mannosyltransferase